MAVYMYTKCIHGDMVYADLTPSVGSEQDGMRPVLIIQNGTGTGITPNIEYLLDSVTARIMISNSEFIVMNNQAVSDHIKLAKLLNVSSEQLEYVTNLEASSGLMRIGHDILPFAKQFPRDTTLYRLMTTRPNEVLNNETEG